jgi:aminoglycoside phosphotransferase (APT) family kinase protein
VVDWELSTQGDPVGDVAMMCAYRMPEFDLVAGLPAAWASTRLPSAGEIAEAYQASGGVDLRHWDFHLALAHYKIAVIAAGIAYRAHRNDAATERQPSSAADAVEPFLNYAASAAGVLR